MALHGSFPACAFLSLPLYLNYSLKNGIDRGDAGMVEQPPSVEVFCSYAPEDEAWLLKLIAHLKLLERQGLVLIWHNRLLTAGTDWKQETDNRLNRASLILL